MRSSIRLLLPLAAVLVFALVFSTPRPAQTQTRAAGHAGHATLRATAPHARAKAGQCVDSAARHDHHATADDASGGEAFDSDVQLMASGKMFARLFGEEVWAAEGAHGAHGFVFEGPPDNDVWAAILPPLMPATHDVLVGPGGDFTFEPSSLTINVGDTVRWIWDTPGHTVTSGGSCVADNLYCSPNNTSCASAPTSSTGFVYTRTFNTAGTFSYYCRIHCSPEGMIGSITVQGAASTFTISGKVVTGDGTAVSGVTMTLSGAKSATATTSATGTYAFSGLAAGNYTVTPSHTNFTFTPANRTYTSLSANQTAQDFTATPKLYSISGTVREGAAGLAGVTMTLTSPSPAGFTPRTVTTDANGLYTFANVPAARNYTLTPTKTNYIFKNTSNTAQSSRTYTNLSGNQTNQDFSATLNVFSISGTVRVGTSGLAGVTMTLTSPSPAGFTPRTVLTSSTGTYSFANVPGGRNYTLTPTKTHYTFKNTSNTTQAFRTYTALAANQTAQDFAATLNLHTISGTVRVGTTGLAGVTMTLTSPTPAGFTPRTVTTTSTGAYTLANVPAGRNYTLTPTKTNYTFKNTSNTTQAFRTYTNLSANQTAQDFAATLKLYSISGTVRLGTSGLAGVTMTLTSPSPAGFTPRTVTTTSTGAYNLANVPAGRNYTLTPTKTHYTFKNTSNTSQAVRTYTNLSANQTAQDFAATLKLYSISGTVRVGTSGLAGVTMTLTSPSPAGFTPRTVTTASTGAYTLANVPAGRNYTLTPTKTNYTFKNTSNTAQGVRTYTNLSANQTAQDFAATLNLYTISGRVTLADGTTGINAVTMTLSSPTPAGFTPRTVMTNSTGNYSFASVPAARNYTLTPTKTNFTFSPTSRSYPNLSANQTGAATAFTGTPTSPIASAFEFGEASYHADEGDGKVEATVKRTGDLSAPAFVDYAAGDGTASERSDYSTALGTLSFAPGEAVKSFTVFLTDDAFMEGDETVRLTLADLTGGAGTSNRSKTAVLTITDNDSSPASTNPIDDPAFFVRQLYVDLLAREPRPEESAALVNLLNQCAAGDTACDRAAVAALVLRSEEFRRRGHFLYRLYDVALGRAPLYREYVRDLRQLREGTGGEPEAGRESFVDEWVKRSREFGERHGALTDPAYVDQLSGAAAAASATRDAALGDLERGSKTRARVLLELVEAGELPRHLVEPASFAVLHFGFLRRDPYPGDVLTLRELMSPERQGQRELIRALITSAEYRSRFGRP